MKKIFAITLIFYILSLLQTSFLINGLHNKFLDFNFLLFFIIFINLFEKKEENFGLLSSTIGGFFIDVFSEKQIGFHILILFGLSIFIKLILRRYIRLPVLLKYGVLQQKSKIHL